MNLYFTTGSIINTFSKSSWALSVEKDSRVSDCWRQATIHPIHLTCLSVYVSAVPNTVDLLLSSSSPALFLTKPPHKRNDLYDAAPEDRDLVEKYFFFF